MPRLKRSGPVAAAVWLLALLPMLLASALVVPRLNTDAFNGDENHTLASAGISQDEPRYLTEVWNNTAPRVAPGWAGLISAWARIAGWSEFAVRILATFAGLLTIALVFRSGSDFFSPIAGILAASLLGTSVFFLAYMLRAGPYAGVSLFATLAVWSYWKIAHSSRTPGFPGHGGLLLGSIGLMFSHYLAALILVPLGFAHLFSVPRGRSWWNTTIVFALAALAGVIQLPLLPQGLDYTANEDKGSLVLSAPALLNELLGGLSNGVLAVSTPAQEAFATGLFLFLLACLLWHIRSKGRHDPFSFLGTVLVVFLVLVGLANELLRIIVDTRLRYLMPLWPLCALLAGSFLSRLFKRNSRLTRRLLLLWLCLAVWLFTATSFRYEQGAFFYSRLHRVTAAAADQVTEHEGLVVRIDNTFRGIRQAAWMAQEGKMRYPFSLYLSGREDVLSTLMSARSSHPFVWLMRHDDKVAISSLEALESGLRFCERVLDQWGFKLERYTGTASQCPGASLRLEYGPDIHWGAALAEKDEGSLRVEVHLYSSDWSLLDSYSLALHVIDPATGEAVAQGDVGVGPGTFVPVRSDIDVGALPPGDYELHVALYNWQTGERLVARDSASGLVSDMHVLQRFRVD